MFNTKDNVGIILKGTENSETDNGIQIVRPLRFPSIELFEDIENISTEHFEGDCNYYIILFSIRKHRKCYYCFWNNLRKKKVE